MPDLPDAVPERPGLSPAANRRGLRLALGASAAFSLALLIGWPLATFSAVFVTLFLQAPVAIPARAFRSLFQLAVVLLVASWLIASVLSPYPVPFLLAVAMAVSISFRWGATGAGKMSVVLALIASLMVPNLVIVSQELTWLLVIWLPINLCIAWLWTVFMFWLIPPGAMPAPAAEAPGGTRLDPGRLVLRMSLVTIPFAVLFFLSGSGMLITLFFVAILSMQLAAARGAGPTVAKGMLMANVVGGIAAVIAYNVTVIAPLMVVAMLVMTLGAVTLARWLVSDRADSALAGSALSTMIIIFGGAISPFSGDADVKMIDRLWQIGLALAFVLLAYVIVDRFFPLHRSAPPSGEGFLRRRRKARRAARRAQRAQT
ncbi:DUF2955 domain-containing protein [Shimia aestuarii]|uniref:DUF2955 domain-containing protein n=1 Tax=Shimia aestuarii TaxID=254406 RepID=A0A1I4JX22_9RHOB|nr:DUF2955 domain-containing protein [Shimia aestuarii]SFL70901.1 Protein of unknown function [Shimia aestuarii]